MYYDPNLVLRLSFWQKDGATFMSDDAHGHLCTVTGATWGIQGRTFDGTDDKISIPHNAVFNVSTGDFTAVVWAKVVSFADARTLVVKEIAGGGTGILSSVNTDGTLWFRVRQDASNYAILSGAGQVLSINTFYHIVFLRTGTTLKAYINGVQSTGLTQSGLGAGGGSNPDSAASSFVLGLRSDNSFDFYGTMGEALFYNNRALSPAEIQHNYLASRWRYQ